MSQTRALFASIGAGVSLVVAAALSLLAVSAVFAFGGWSDPVVGSVKQTAITLPVGGGAEERAETAASCCPRPRLVMRRAGRAATGRRAPPAARGARSRRPNRRSTSVPKPVSLPPQIGRGPETVAPTPAVAAPRKSVGDRVRTAGDDITSTVDDVGTASRT